MATSKQPKIKERVLDEDSFRILYDLFRDCTNDNISKASRMIGVHRRTFELWNTKPPKQWWWTHALYACIMDIQVELSDRKSKKRQLVRGHITAQIDKLPIKLKQQFRFEVNTFDAQAVAVSTAEKVLIVECVLSEDGKVDPEQLMVRHHLSRATFTRAANRLGMKMKHKGFGLDKVTTWRLPKQWDLSNTKKLVRGKAEL